jgi:shikimate kinase
LNNLILCGFKGCGKTYFGKRASALLQIPFIDTDQLIEEAYLRLFNTPLSCTQIGREKGNSYFRQLEKECIHSLGDIKNSLISLGGGSILDPDNVLFLKKRGMLLYLKMDKEVLKKRMLYQNGLKNREFDKEVLQNSDLERVIIVRGQGASEDRNFEGQPTQSKTDSSIHYGIAHELSFFIDPSDPEKSFENMYHERKKKYEDVSSKTIDLQDKTDEQVLKEIGSLYGK